MIALFVALCLMSGTWLALRGGFAVAGGRGLKIIGYDTNAIGLGALAILVAVYYYGWQYGLALVLSVVIHEYGHVVAYRVCGHDDARFRLIPIMGGMAISNRIPTDQQSAFFIALMGPAICLAPMGMCFALADLLSTTYYPVAEFLGILGLILGFFNFFNLLPFWPLDGGRIVQILAQSFLPKATRQVSIAMTVIGAALAFLTHSYIILFFILISWGGLMQSEKLLEIQRPMTKSRALLALAAYAFTAAAFFLGGAQVLGSLI